ncbi:MAG: AbrB/MazE/SpoVT family DNA-binding domain-containing protein [Candidatus Omnitrophica bacterium]|nr:AbrB/MazE/SpoVT family DNA-binding domain-containing protein [Candidatus Omnitrophota bacterium]
MAKALVKIQKNKNITLPMWLIHRFHVEIGDFVRLEETKDGILMKPAKLIDPSQAYFWTKEWQEGEKEAEEDIRQGRIKKFKSVKALMDDLKT